MKRNKQLFTSSQDRKNGLRKTQTCSFFPQYLIGLWTSMIARELIIIATTTSSSNLQRKHIRLTVAIELKLLVLLA